MALGLGTNVKCQALARSRMSLISLECCESLDLKNIGFLDFTSAGSHVFKLSDKFATDDKNIDGQCRDICQDILVMDIND